MSLWIPRIEWNEFQIVGDSVITSDTLINFASTTGIVAGMTCTGAGIPANTTVLVVNPTSIQLSEDATGNNVGATYSFFWRYDFEFPPVKDSEFVRKPSLAVSTSLSGLIQVQTAFLEGERELEFWFVNQTDADLLQDNWYIYAYKGNGFRYYPDKDESPVYNVELNKYDFKRNRQVKKHPNFKYSLSMSIRYVVE